MLLLLALLFSLVDFDGFHAWATTANNWILTRFDWLFSLASFAAVLLVIWVAISPLGKVRVGGPNAKPILKRWNWLPSHCAQLLRPGFCFGEQPNRYSILTARLGFLGRNLIPMRLRNSRFHPCLCIGRLHPMPSIQSPLSLLRWRTTISTVHIL